MSKTAASLFVVIRGLYINLCYEGNGSLYENKLYSASYLCDCRMVCRTIVFSSSNSIA